MKRSEKFQHAAMTHLLKSLIWLCLAVFMASMGLAYINNGAAALMAIGVLMLAFVIRHAADWRNMRRLSKMERSYEIRRETRYAK